MDTMNKAIRTILTVMAAIVWMSAASYGAPRLTMPETVFDFGFAPQNATISHKFWLISTGEDTLKILKVIPG